ncbi:MAG: glycosyltransferase family 2 protein [Tannerellaceae bacterium]|jgi:glycosyltransferase involved in cell wall biosynthesis|nr:glycosyltransferase family 2 protein [Tannerellaceae bacterium]
MDISVVIHTLNSEGVIRQCLESVKGFDEIILCDMYSSDNTLSIAREYGATIVLHEPCGGIPEPARTFAIRQATKEWVFVVDSDEIVPSALKDYLYRSVSQSNPVDALFVPRRNFFMNKYMRSSFPDYQLRFFRKDKFVTWPPTVHARPQINGRIRKLPARKELAFIHLDTNRINAMIAKMNKYTNREMERSKNRNVGLGRLIFKPAYRFIHSYFFKGGFWDGKAGFIYAVLNMYYKFVAISKCIEKREIKG